ncbi:MAG: hypothetical protein KDK35_16355 [Leptospiraceae bacterium]|nr:hypothetical protein [Leptospiraceae bacterium]
MENPNEQMAANTAAPPSFRIRFLIRLLRAVYKPVVRRAARQALEGRLVAPGSPQAGRWLRRDVQAYLGTVWSEVDRLAAEANLEQLPTLGNRHNVFLAVVTTAAYRCLVNQGSAPDYSMLLVGDVGWKVYERLLRLAAFPFRIVTRSRQRRVELTLRSLMIFPFSAPGAPGYEVKAWASEEGFHTHWTHCPPYAFARGIDKKYKKGELEAFYRSWCLYDWAAADVLVDDGKKGHYTRPKTLSRGDRVCDMCWHAGQLETTDRRNMTPSVQRQSANPDRKRTLNKKPGKSSTEGKARAKQV